MEQTLDPVNCDTPACALKTACHLNAILPQAQALYLDHFSRFTIADLVNQKNTDVIRLIT